MKIRKNIIWCVTWIVLLLQLDILGGIIPFFSDAISWKIEMLLVLFDSMLAIFTLCKNGDMPRYRALNCYIVIYLICLLGISYYTVHEGVANVDHTIMYVQEYFSAFLVYPFLYLEQRYGKEKSFMASWLPIAAIALCFRMLNCLAYDIAGIALFPTLIAGQVRGGHSTSVCGAIENIFLIYSFYLFLKCGRGLTKTKIKYLIYLIIGLVYSIRFVGSRIMIVSLIASMVVLWYGRQKQGAKKMLAFSIGVIVIAVFMQTPFYGDLLQTIQGASSSVNDIYNGNTMSVRLYSLETLRRNWNGKPMGLAFYGTSAFKHYFVIGSNDDLGYLGNWYTMGWYCVPIIVLLIVGYLYTSIRNFGKNNAEIIYSMIIYLLITGVSLSFLDVARIDVVPFLLFFLQTWKWNGDDLEELGYDG